MAVREMNDVTVDDIPNLDDDELIYLQQRSKFNKEVQAELEDRGIDVSVNHDPVYVVHNQPNFGNANTDHRDPPRTRQEGEEDDSYLEAMAVDPKNLTKPQLVGAGVEDDDDDDDVDFEIPDNDDYGSWTNDQLRAELQRRANEDAYEADLDGNKKALVQRLKDQDQAKAST